MPRLQASPLPDRWRPRFSERGFRWFAALTTLAGISLMAWGLNLLILESRFVPFLALFLAGGVLASLSVFAEVRPPTPEELAAAAARDEKRLRRARRWSGTEAAAPEEGGAEDEAAFTVTFYTREGCAVCREARAQLDAWRERYGFDVWEEDVDANAALREQWSDWVPVGMVGEEELFRLSLDPATVEPRLAALAREREPGQES